MALFQAVDAALNEDQPSRALILSLRLNEDSLVKKCILAVNPADISAVASSIPFRYLQRLIEALTDLLEGSPFLEFILRWCQVCIKLLTNLTENCSVIRSCSAYISLIVFLSILAGDLQNPWSFDPTKFEKLASSLEILAESNYKFASGFGRYVLL